MRTRLLLAFAFAAAVSSMNVATAGNIAYGVGVVVIDPGHGGKIPGAQYGGVYEKDIVLKVGLKLGRLIEQGMPGVKVVYTRTTDRMLASTKTDDLQARADIANGSEGELFISIHANAAPVAAARGVETLIMGESPKEQFYNEKALFESNREDLLEVGEGKQAAIVRARIQNMQFTYGEYSMAMARCVQRNYGRAGRYVRKIKSQLLRVLYATDMPGILTEIGFMSNPEELAYMRSEKGQNEIARNLYQAVRDYSDYVLSTRSGDDGAAAASVQPESAGETIEEISSGAQPQAERIADKNTEEIADTKAGESAGESAGAGSAANTPAAASTVASSAAKTPAASTAASSAASTAASSAASTAASSAAKPKASAAGSSSGSASGSEPLPVRFTVQILSSVKAVPLTSREFKTYRGQVTLYKAGGRLPYKYCVGEFDTQSAALQQARQIRKVFPDAFVVRCRGTKIVK